MAICSLVPAGTIRSFGGALPTGHLLCDGSSYLTTAYPVLFAAIGYTWGGSGSNFNVPDFRGKVPMGSGQDSANGLSNRTLAEFTGNETHALSVGELASHSHIDAGHSHTDAGHSHNMSPYDYNTYVTSGSGGGIVHFNVRTNYGNLLTENSSASIETSYASLENTGSGVGHNNVQPSLVVTCCIKY
jgi:microcystin-dependent protein